MTIVYADFIAAFPEFGNTALYPQTQINFWIPQAYRQLNAFRFGAEIDLAAMLFVAHNIVLSARESKSSAAGQVAGSVTGPMSSKSIGPLSISYSGATSIDGAGAYNYTSYGQRLYNLMRAYAAGPKWVPRTAYSSNRTGIL